MKNFHSKQSKDAKGFWNKEYKKGKPGSRNTGHLALSNNPSEDLIKFTTTGEYQYLSMYALINDLCRRQILEKGNYLISVSW